jgi:hypothetical protein
VDLRGNRDVHRDLGLGRRRAAHPHGGHSSCHRFQAYASPTCKPEPDVLLLLPLPSRRGVIAAAHCVQKEGTTGRLLLCEAEALLLLVPSCRRASTAKRYMYLDTTACRVLWTLRGRSQAGG